MPAKFINNSKSSLLLLVISAILALVIGDAWELPMNESVGVGLLIYLIAKIIKNIGKTVWVFLDVVSLLLVLTCLVVPLFFYHYFTDTNELAVLWVKYMPIRADVYYNFVMPASLALIIGFNIPLVGRKDLNYSVKEYIKTGVLSRPAKLGFQIISISLFVGFISSSIPGALGFVAFLFTRLIFVGFLYLYFSGKKPNIRWMFIAGGLLLFQSLQAAMFGELIYLTLLAVIFLTYGNNYSTLFKTSVITLGVTFLLIIQSVKHEYRQSVWAETKINDSGSNIALFANLATQQTQAVSSGFADEKLFFTAVRFNQGWLIASVMKNVPTVVPYANGETIWLSLLASIAPRFLWPDKPKAGGRANIERFLGWDLGNTSMNIGLLGESYVNFGVWGGCVFLFFYGLAFQWAYNFCIRLTHVYPTLIMWMPLLFFYCIGVENDVLTVVNHLMKTGFFVYLLYKFYPRIFKINL